MTLTCTPTRLAEVVDQVDHVGLVLVRALRGTHRAGLAQIMGQAQASDRDSQPQKTGPSRTNRAENPCIIIITRTEHSKALIERYGL